MSFFRHTGAGQNVGRVSTRHVGLKPDLRQATLHKGRA